MARTANVFARVEPDIKEQAERVLDQLGIPMSNAVGMFLRQIVLQKGIPFEMKLPRTEPLAYGALNIAYELLEPDTAAGQTGRSMKAVRSLEEMPIRHRLLDEEPWHSQGMRLMPVDHYLVFYLPDETNNVVSIIRIMYGGRDVRRQIGEIIN